MRSIALAYLYKKEKRMNNPRRAKRLREPKAKKSKTLKRYDKIMWLVIWKDETYNWYTTQKYRELRRDELLRWQMAYTKKCRKICHLEGKTFVPNRYEYKL
jgi:hypothetical protein